MTAYCLFDNLEVMDESALDEYRTKVADVVRAYGGDYVVVGGPFRVVEGDWSPTFPVMLTFPDLATANAWYDSEEYRDLKALRHGAVRNNAVFFDSSGADELAAASQAGVHAG